MSDDIHVTPITLELNGKKYQCSLVGGSDRAAAREFVREGRVRAIKNTCREYSGEVFSSALAKAASTSVTDAELYAFMSSEEGMTYMVWRGVQRNHPEVTFEVFREWASAEMLQLFAQEQYQKSGYLSEGGDPHSLSMMPDYDLSTATLMRYYHLSVDEVGVLTPTQIAALVSHIPEVAKNLGETAE